MKKAALYSLALHVAIILVFFVFPFFFTSKIEMEPPITVEIATVSELTQAPRSKPSDKPPVKAEPKSKPVEKPQPPKPIEKPAPSKPMEKPVEKPEPLKPVEKPIEKPAEKPKEPEKKPEEKPKEKEKVKPKEKQKPKPDEDLDIDSVLQNLDKAKSKREKKQEEDLDLDSVLRDLRKDLPVPETPIKEAKVTSDKPMPNVREGDQISVSERDAVSRQFVPCWNLLAGAKGAQDMVIEIKIHANPDGSIADAHIVDTGRMALDGAFSAAASSALRAVKNPKCSPLKLAPEKYNQWKNITLRFNPKEMF